MTNEQFRDAFCDSSRSNSANTFHDEGIFRLISNRGIIFQNLEEIIQYGKL